MRGVKSVLGLLSMVCLGLSYAWAQNSDKSNPISIELLNLEQSTLLSRGDVGLWVQDVESGEVLVNYKAERSFMPASNLKIITTATALELLGPDYRYHTKGYYSGKIDSLGVLKGELRVIGSGDPSLGSDQIAGRSLSVLMNTWSNVLLKQGVKTVTGDLIVDVSAYDRNPVPDFWPWADLGNYYGAGTYGLNMSDNTVKLYFQQHRRQGEKVKFLRSEPNIKGVSYTNGVVTGPEGSKDQAYIYGAPYQANRMILGTLPPGEGEYKIKGAMPDPPAWFGFLLKQALKSEGITVQGNVIVSFDSKKMDSFQPWFDYQSPALSELARITNYYSINLYAESLFQQIAWAGKGKGDREEAVHEVKRFWSSVGIDTLGWILMDGSGLSPLNAISPEQMGGVLRYMVKDSKSKTAFVQSLPKAGKDGTVYWFGKNTTLENNVQLKSGSFRGTLCYSGYMTTKSNKRVVFSIMMNRYEGEMRTAAKKLLPILEKLIAEY